MQRRLEESAPVPPGPPEARVPEPTPDAPVRPAEPSDLRLRQRQSAWRKERERFEAAQARRKAEPAAERP
jgi:hypothetical protein